jgi:integrase
MVGESEFSESFEYKVAADDLRTDIILAIRNREQFSPITGRPVSWATEDMTIAAWAKTWFDKEKVDAEPRTRRSTVEPISLVLVELVKPRATQPPASLIKDIRMWLLQDSLPCPAWLARFSINISDVTPDRCKEAEQRMSRTEASDTGASRPRARNTMTRYRSNIRRMMAAAVERSYLPAQPWPSAPSGKVKNSQKRTSKIRFDKLPDETAGAEAIGKMLSHQPGSRNHQVTAALIFYSGLRPSEARALPIENITWPLPGEKHGWIHVNVAAKDAGEDYGTASEDLGPPKTEDRDVIMPPPLVELLRAHIGKRKEGLVCSTRNGTPVLHSNLYRKWCQARGEHEWSLYDLRHARATIWLNMGLPIGQVARWLGHSPEVLLSTYAGILLGDRDRAASAVVAMYETA